MRTAEGYWATPWTDEEVGYLRDSYGSVPVKQIAERLGRSYNAVVLRARIEGFKSRHRAGGRSLTPGYFRTIDTPVKAYLLGLIAADGWVSPTGQLVLALAEKDTALVEFARDNIAPAARIGSYMSRATRMIDFKVQSAGLAVDLASWGIIPNKTLVMTWPSALPAEMARSYLHGYFDGDGSLGRQPLPRWAVVSGSETFLVDAQRFIQAECGVKVGGPYPDRRHNFAWSIIATGEPVRALDAWLQQDGLGLARKRLAP